MSEHSKHFLTKYTTYMVKAISLMYDCGEKENLVLSEPLEALTKMTKAVQVIEDSNQTELSKWLLIDCTLC
jgi:hypothetical protein